MEAELKFQIMRSEIQAAADLDHLRKVALQVVDMAEMQQRTTNAMLREAFLRPRPPHPSLLESTASAPPS